MMKWLRMAISVNGIKWLVKKWSDLSPEQKETVQGLIKQLIALVKK